MKSIIVCLLFIIMSTEGKSQSYPFHLEKKRELDNNYQKDKIGYDLKIDQTRQILSVRAGKAIKQVISSAPVQIVNRGRAEALAVGNAIYIDIALLDLLSHFSDELSLAEVKQDPYHSLEFNLTYAVSLNGDKTLQLISAYNTLKLSQEQYDYLWNTKLIEQEVIFNQILGFILAHEISHIVLNHEKKIEEGFPVAGDRTIENPHWNKIRREEELEADSLASFICLKSLIQPAQLIPWLDLYEIRQRFYGRSSEYPTTTQRISVINKVYQMLIDKNKLSGDLMEFKPLPPHRDLFQGDYYMFLNEFQKVRKYRQMLLMGIDESVVSLIRNNVSLEEAVNTFIVLIEQQKDLLRGAKNKDAIRKLSDLIPNDKASSFDRDQMITLLHQAGIGSFALALLEGIVSQNEIDWDEVKGYLSMLNQPAAQFLDGIMYDYFVANSAVRWYPEAFEMLRKILPENEKKAKSFKPYQIGHPTRNPLPSFEEQIKALKNWDGNY